MNRHDVIEKVARDTNVDPATCGRVVDALEKIMQEELAAFRGPGQAFAKLSGFLGKFFSGSHTGNSR